MFTFKYGKTIRKYQSIRMASLFMDNRTIQYEYDRIQRCMRTDFSDRVTVLDREVGRPRVVTYVSLEILYRVLSDLVQR